MLAVLALALEGLPHPLRSVLADQVLIGTTAWLAEEGGRPPHQSAALDQVVRNVTNALSSVACLGQWTSFPHQRSAVPEGLRTGLCQGRRCRCAAATGSAAWTDLQQLVADCDSAAEQLQPRAVTSEL